MADSSLSFMPREWVEAQGFVWADALLAAVLLGLVALSYIMLAHMLRSWGDSATNASAAAGGPQAVASSPASGGVGGGESAGGVAGTRIAGSCAEYGPVHEEIDGMTALMRASSQGDEACAVELIAAGASVDARDSQEGFTALLMASAMGARTAFAPPALLRLLLPHTRLAIKLTSPLASSSLSLCVCACVAARPLIAAAYDVTRPLGSRAPIALGGGGRQRAQQ